MQGSDMQHHEIKVPEDENCKIWRYMDFQQCYYLFNFKKLTFASPLLFDDALEGVLTQQFKHEIVSRIKDGDRAAVETEFHNLFVYSESSNISQYFSGRVFISCWHCSDHENMSMWKLYGGVNKGVAVVSTYKKLRDMLSADISIGCIEYIDINAHQTSKWLPNFIVKYFRKRKAYENEREMRAVYFHPHDGAELSSPIYECDINPAYLIDRVVISPFANEEFVKSVKNIIPESVVCEKSKMSLEIDDPEKLTKLHNYIIKLLKKYAVEKCLVCNTRGYVKKGNNYIFCDNCIGGRWQEFKAELLTIIDA